MELFFSQFQRNAIKHIWILGLITAALQVSNYFIYNYGADTTTLSVVTDIQTWLLQSLLFSWYFYRNRLVKQGIIIQFLFIPYYILGNDVALFIDYHTSFNNIEFLYSLITPVLFFVPILFFSIFYFKTEKGKPALMFKPFIVSFLLTAVLSETLDSDPDNVFSFLSFFNSDSLLLKDLLVSTILSIIACKSVFVLIGFFYLSNRIYSIKTIINPLNEQYITKKLWLWGFIISYTIGIFVVIDLGRSILVFTFSAFEIRIVTYLLSCFFILFVSGKFLGALIQFRNYSLKKYFGVINSLAAVPVFNLIPLFVLYFSKLNSDIAGYISSLPKKRIIHLTIYCILVVVFVCYNYFTEPPEVRELTTFIRIPVFIIAICLLSRYKISTRIVPLAIVAIFYYKDLIDYFHLTNGLLSFFKEKVISFAWLTGISIVLIYYVAHYILHKSFYTTLVEQKSPEDFEEDLKMFEK